jgi:hypothetical protein
MNQRLSSLRAQLLRMRQQLPQLLEVFLGREPLLPGSLYTLRRKCGKPTCHCRHDALHESTVLSFRRQGKTQHLSPPPQHLPPLRTMTEQARRCRQARAALLRWQRQLLQFVDALLDVRRQLGERALRQLGRPRPRKPPSTG